MLLRIGLISMAANTRKQSNLKPASIPESRGAGSLQILRASAPNRSGQRRFVRQQMAQHYLKDEWKTTEITTQPYVFI
jgi:hypothetical protein